MPKCKWDGCAFERNWMNWSCGDRRNTVRSPQSEVVRAERAPSPGMELDMRGQTVEDALPELERYLDAAYLADLPWVRIIHGKGTGKLRQGVRDFLRASPVVKSYETGKEEEGGDGVTVVKLVSGD